MTDVQGSLFPDGTAARQEAGFSGAAAAPAPGAFEARLDAVIEEARARLVADQAEDGHWLYPLEADATIPAEFILLGHFIDDVDRDAEQGLAQYLRDIQGDHGGWPLFDGGDLNLSASVKAYYALKLTGDDPDAPHMARARRAILEAGGAADCNVFTRITLALFGQVPWQAVPMMPIEIMLLPRWFPFHLSKISYWSRTVLVPLLILMAQHARAVNPRNCGIEELFLVPPFGRRSHLVNPTGATLGKLFIGFDRVLRRVVPLFPKGWKQRATDRALDFITRRINGTEGLGGIFPAMANSVMVFHTLGYDRDEAPYATARAAVRKLLVTDGERSYCQSCLSPIWDTALAMHALMEAGDPDDARRLDRAGAWLVQAQITDTVGDWAEVRPGLAPAGWPFQYANDYYPDTDDSSVVIMALDRVGGEDARRAVDSGAEWILGMQCANGGWGSFDADNTYHYLNHIPFADHGALLDPPTADVTARCVGMLAQRGLGTDHPAVARGLAYLRDEQEADGSWFGRWGTNYIYGTWSVLCAFNAVGENPGAPHIRRAVEWLTRRQRDDGGWGEDCASYYPDRRDEEAKASTPAQTAWAVLALLAAGEVESEAVRRGVAYLLDAERKDGAWRQDYHNAVGFPRVFYLKYHGYGLYFPMWALARYRRLTTGNAATPRSGL
jgi:squalene-hopene/tetraprenyl-beta-curcumene cyclase